MDMPQIDYTPREHEVYTPPVFTPPVVKYAVKDNKPLVIVGGSIPVGASEITLEEYQGLTRVVPTIEDYDQAMEDHLQKAREDRGYTKREPSDYLGSNNPRWEQDAKDWINFRDSVMLYGLQVQNDFTAGNQIPTLEEFIAHLPQITWTFSE